MTDAPTSILSSISEIGADFFNCSIQCRVTHDDKFFAAQSGRYKMPRRQPLLLTKNIQRCSELFTQVREFGNAIHGIQPRQLDYSRRQRREEGTYQTFRAA